MKKEQDNSVREVQEQFTDLKYMNLILARDPNARQRIEDGYWEQVCTEVLELTSRQPCGRLRETGETLTICRTCGTISPESSHQRHTGDCMRNQLLTHVHNKQKQKLHFGHHH
eukprot:UN26173